MKFKLKNWDKEDEVCPTCGKVTKEQKGITKQNIQKLFKKPTLQDLIILIMIVLMLFGAWAYNQDVKNYREVISHPGELCAVYYESILHGNFGQYNGSDIPPFIITDKNTNDE